MRSPNPISSQPGRYGEIRQAEGLPGGWQPAKGVFGQTVPCGLLTSRETAKALRISEKTLYTLTKSGDIQAVRFGRAVRYDPDVLKRWIEQQSKKANDR